jgi:hypothetical protein
MKIVERGRLIAKSMTLDTILGISERGVGVLRYFKANATLPALMDAAIDPYSSAGYGST